jgi:hypothetical protein
MRCYYPYLNYTPSAVPREDQFGRLKGCSSSTPVTSSVTLSDVLAVGNSAGIYDILMNGQDILGANLIETKILQLNDTINNPSIIQLTGPVLSYLAGANSSSHQFSTRSNTGVLSTPVTISSNSTTITNATTINNLSSTTQPNGTNNTTVATTAFVQNSIVPPMPYFRFSTITTNNATRWLNPFGFQFTGSSWNVNDFFTVRLNVSSFVNLSTPVNYNLTAIFDIYPNRCPDTSAYGSPSGTYSTVGSSGFPQMNGSIFSGGQYVTSYSVPVDATFAPFGRYFYVSSFNLINNLGIVQQPNCLPLYPYITQATQQTNFGFQLWSVSTNANKTEFSITCEIIGNTSSNTIASYGINQFTNFYTTF